MGGRIDRQTDRETVPPSFKPIEPENGEGRPRGNSTIHFYASLTRSVSQSFLLRNLCRRQVSKTVFRRGRRPRLRSKFHHPLGRDSFTVSLLLPSSARRPNSPQKNLSEMSSAKYRPSSLARSSAVGDFARVPSFNLSRRLVRSSSSFHSCMLLSSSLDPEL